MSDLPSRADLERMVERCQLERQKLKARVDALTAERDTLRAHLNQGHPSVLDAVDKLSEARAEIERLKARPSQPRVGW